MNNSKPRRVAVKLDLDWPYKRHSGIFAGVHLYAREHGWHTIVDEYVEDTLIRVTETARYDGVIARTNNVLATRATRLKVPLVNVWSSSAVYKKVPGVFADFAAAGRLRAEHLVSRGLRHFAALMTDDDRGQLLEMQAITEVLAMEGCSVASAQVPLNSSSNVKEWRKTQRTIAAWMDAWKVPTGVVVGNESHGRIVAQECHNRGWRVPEDVAIIAGRNEETLCEGLHPTLSSVEMGYDRIGYEAARLLDGLMDGHTPPNKPLLIPPVGIVARESTDFYAVDDPLVAAALRFIAANSHLEIGQDAVSQAVATETRTLQRRFQKYLKRPIVAEIRRVRLERAKRELARGERTIKEIAKISGFGEAMRMYDVFRRELGVTPSHYRRERSPQSKTTHHPLDS